MADKLEGTITNEQGRIDKVLSERLTSYSRSQIQQWLKEGLVVLNGQKVKANYQVKPDDHFIIHLPEEKPLEVEACDIPLDVVYQDQDVAVVNKPQGMVVHPSHGHPTHTLVNALLFHLDQLSGINGVIRPGIVHRIDKDTSGLLMVAKNDRSHTSLAQQLQDKTTLREYTALVHGNIPHQKGTITAPIGRSKTNRQMQDVVDDGKFAVTHFTVLERFADFTLIKLQLETGRTHQIRVHMKYIGYPIAGDPVYGPKRTLKGNGQFLHAGVLGFTHPTSGQWLTFEAPLPEVFKKTLDNLAKPIDF
ncbi:RluA family pseudouridine synthase [Tetragenococcus koreensis]|uniref:Pseudouridine synthase n=1 Tax=Tetragenococcus koreensis TaxID=290335 RepID=A0AAN4ZQD2_9ENTE|nr:RluA family pseudouridine synthase [Tetragenococcus koreensis]AYW45011.1 RluA family pseudouridine synthase [Tetragenococcus koreensis]MCF1584984.1 RluA family pseudouridine synthase [Tetragenococcus koreensis]MCF1614497.1 RluA family pseudouridine synthase [Tetragenococcus koreensis]MCF1616156.1 RluA family pseudouridine synthase [Tetragenococcus koreensis]MCF1618492.1 RluA family pseudouridine synthase [Tetragenococcus koreensis]